jgi:hypothetical protein
MMDQMCNFMKCMYQGHAWKEVPLAPAVRWFRWMIGAPVLRDECERCGAVRDRYE